MLLAQPVLRRLSYEFFLRSHQCFAILLIWFLWQHLPDRDRFPQWYLLISACILTATSIIEMLVMAKRSGWAGATVSSSHGMVKVKLQLRKPLQVDAGQYINLWIPLGLRSAGQSHPFVVTSFVDGPSTTLELFVQPRRGLTRDLLHQTSYRKHAQTTASICFGPYGRSMAVGKYTKVVLAADDVGIAAHLPYLKKLIYGYHHRQVITRRIHLIWQISDIGVFLCHMTR